MYDYTPAAGCVFVHTGTFRYVRWHPGKPVPVCTMTPPLPGVSSYIPERSGMYDGTPGSGGVIVQRKT